MSQTTISTKDISVLASEFSLSSEKAEHILRENGGDLKAALSVLLNA